jgi:Rrf2 family protein
MKVSRKGEYALRAMIDLSLNYDKGNVQIRDISQREKIPQKFLEQILLTLKNAGLLQSKRGIGGGYSLIKPPGKISLAEVIRIIDGPLAPLSCVSQWAHVNCPEEKNCGLYMVMLDVRNAIAAMLENITFEDVCKRTKGMLDQRTTKRKK